MEIFAIVLLSMSVVTWGFPQYIEPAEIEGHLDDAYQFAYAVASPEHGDYHGHQQTRDENGFTSGSYYLLGADGQWSQTIFADKGAGFQALYNQRPAGAPPPQVSEVTYQVFVHPGATAISAQGGAPPQGGIQQKSLINQQPQINQITQSQNRQPSLRFNRNTQVPDSANQQPRFNRNSIVPESASLAVLTPVVDPEQRPRTNLRQLTDLATSASDNLNQVKIYAPKPQPVSASDNLNQVKIYAPRPQPVSASDNSNQVKIYALKPQPVSASDNSNQVKIYAPKPQPVSASDNLNQVKINAPKPQPVSASDNLNQVKIYAPKPQPVSASDNSNKVMINAPNPRRSYLGVTRQQPATSIFNDDISNIFRILQSKTRIPLN